MILRQLIKALESVDPNRKVKHGFTNPHSYRGYYNELAFEPAQDVTVGSMLSDAKEALNNTYTGYKGGEFTMRGFTDVYLAYYGETGEMIGPHLLGYMLSCTCGAGPLSRESYRDES